MAERRDPRGVGQRRLDADDRPDVPSAPVEETAPVEDAPEPGPVTPTPPPVSHEPSETLLRERQARWLRTRAEYEARQRGASGSPDAANASR